MCDHMFVSLGTDRFLFPADKQPRRLWLAVLINQSATLAWHLNPGKNRAFQRAAEALPLKREGSSPGLLLLGTRSTHQKDGKWTSIE